MSISRLIIGLILVLGGIFFIVLGSITTWWMIIYGIPLIIIGIVIIFNKTEDKIEKRKDLKEKEYKQ